jgi:hypothetical protein
MTAAGRSPSGPGEWNKVQKGQKSTWASCCLSTSPQKPSIPNLCHWQCILQNTCYNLPNQLLDFKFLLMDLIFFKFLLMDLIFLVISKTLWLDPNFVYPSNRNCPQHSEALKLWDVKGQECKLC